LSFLNACITSIVELDLFTGDRPLASVEEDSVVETCFTIQIAVTDCYVGVVLRVFSVILVLVSSVTIFFIKC